MKLITFYNLGNVSYRSTKCEKAFTNWLGFSVVRTKTILLALYCKNEIEAVPVTMLISLYYGIF